MNLPKKSTLLKLYTTNKNPILIVLTTKLFLFVIGFIHLHLNTNMHPKNFTEFIAMLEVWDVRNYITIATQGYSAQPDQAALIAHYPLFPILIRLTNYIFHSPTISTFILSTTLSFLAGISLYHLVKLHFPDQIATDTVWFLFLFPTSYFLHIGYTESLFIFLVAVYFYQFQSRLPLSSLTTFTSSFFAALTKPLGLLLIPPAFLNALLTKKPLTKVLAISGPFFGLAFFLLINQLVFGNPLHFNQAYQSHFRQQIHSPIQGLRDIYAHMDNDFSSIFVTNYSERFFFSATLILTLIGLKKLPSTYSTYSITLLIFLLCVTSYLRSSPRHLLLIFPQFIILSLLLKSRPNLNLATKLLSAGLLLTLSNHMITGSWTY